MLKVPDIRNKKIWIAGHKGLVGSACNRIFEEKGCHNIITVTRDNLDLTRQRETEEWLAENKPDIIVLAAAQVGGIAANLGKPAEMIFKNLAIAQNVIHSAYKTGIEKLLYLGSSCIYPPQEEKLLKESDLLSRPLEPSNEYYALAKITGIKLCEAYRKQYGCNFISVMPCNLYGINDKYDENNSHVIPSLIMKIHHAKVDNAPSVTLWGTGKPRREFLYADDVATALYHILEHYDESLPINIGMGEDISILDLALKIKAIIGYRGDILFDETKPDGAHKKLMDSSRMRAMGWMPGVSLEKGLKNVYRDYLFNCLSDSKVA